PPGAALAASSFLAPHLAQREQLYFFPGNKSYPLSYVEQRAEYLVADRRPPSGNREERELLADYLRLPDWELIAQQGDFMPPRRPTPSGPTSSILASARTCGSARCLAVWRCCHSMRGRACCPPARSRCRRWPCWR